MGLTVNILSRKPQAGSVEVSAKVTFDSSYATGGEALTPADLGLTTLDAVNVYPSGGYLFDYDYTAKKLKALYPTAASAGSVSTIELSHAGSDIKGSANTDSENADAASLPTNGALVCAETAVAAGAWTAPAITNPDVGRNLCVVVHNDSGGSLNLYEGVMTVTITGTWRGATQSTAITFTSTAGNKAVANTKYRYKYGNKPFDTVTAVTLDHVPDDGLKIAVGIGSKMGLPTDLATPVVGDVIKITKNAANLANSGVTDTTNMTVNLGALADGDDFNIVYKAKSAVTASAVAAEVANTTNLSAVTCRLTAWGL